MPRAALWAVLAFAGVAWTGCRGPQTIAEFTFLTNQQILRPIVLRPGHRREWCPTDPERMADHARAIERAIADVPDANVMTNVLVWVPLQEHYCVVVLGDVGRVE